MLDGFAASSPRVLDGTFDFWRTAHRALRGRYRIALLLSVCGVLAGGSVGAMLGQRLYSVTGLVRIASVLPQVLRETDQNRPIANFEGFIQAQREVMSSREIIREARRNERWLEVTESLPEMSEERFAASVKVETRPRSDHLRVTFKDPNPEVAAAAVASIIAAYERAFTDDQHEFEDQRQAQLQTRRTSLSEELRELKTEIQSTASGRTLADIEPLCIAAAERVRKLSSALVDVQCALAGGPDSIPRQAAIPRQPGDIVADELLRTSVAELVRAETQLAHAQSQGYGPEHRYMVRLTATVSECRDRVARSTQATLLRHAESPAGPNLVSLTEREASLSHLVQVAQDEMELLATQRQELDSLSKRALVLRDNLTETDARLDALATEGSMGGRLSIVSSGDEPMTALLDNRVKATAAGTLGGAALPFALTILYGVVRRRYRFADEVAEDLLGRTPFVVVLPVVSACGANDATAVHAVHDLRVRLQPTGSSDSRAYLMTSATAGEGKSGLCVALGLSFAAAGFRTLVVDGDVANRGLTCGFQAAECPGLIEAIEGGEPLIWRTLAGLSVLTVGRDCPTNAYRIAPAATGRLLALLRTRFDIVLIDSDPILTGLTSSVITPHVDGVVCAVEQGQEQALVHKAVQRIEMLGGRLSGTVFNRGTASDFRGVFKNQAPATAAEHRFSLERTAQFGPLVGMMLESLSLMRDDELELQATAITLAQPVPKQRAA